jgi:hypothetical protein
MIQSFFLSPGITAPDRKISEKAYEALKQLTKTRSSGERKRRFMI